MIVRFSEEEIDLSLYIPGCEYFPYVSTSGINLAMYQILQTVNPCNYENQCFVFACDHMYLVMKKCIK